MNEPAIVTQGLAKAYAGVRAVTGINLTVPRGSIYGFLGRNGAGKTTTIKVLLGLVRPTAGSARVLGFDTRREHIAILQRTAFVSEKKTLYPSLTASELVRFSRGFYPTWLDSAVEKYAQLFEIPMKQRFEQLSNGNQTKVWLLLALCQGADLLILDEPTTALDPITVDQLMRVLAEDALDRGCTIFFSSHQLEEVERIAEYVGFIDHGKLLMEARLDDIKSEFRLITAAGTALPLQLSPQVLSVDVEGAFYRYVVTADAEGFAAGLSQNGATVTSITPLGLREIFLQLVRKEQSCTSGNAGATLVPSSSRF
ncbi:MAG TPA: ABC transporter ATP-binding protein [Candidatus Binatus sp.]|jgi:ABC-2 type transport system ATP-binding protein|nr:ABC transporter ATP-binding protein [Candidatus Binatus sp.]